MTFNPGPVLPIPLAPADALEHPSVTPTPDGGYVVTYTHEPPSTTDQPAPDYEAAQRFRADGTPLGPELKLGPTSPTNLNSRPVDSNEIGSGPVVVDGQGNLLIAVEDTAQSSDTGASPVPTKVVVKRVDASGAVSAPLALIADPQVDIVPRKIVATPSGGFVVGYFKPNDASAALGPVFMDAQFFDPQGKPLGAPIPGVIGLANDFSGNPIVVTASDGQTVAATMTERRYDASGNPIGDPIEIPTPTIVLASMRTSAPTTFTSAALVMGFDASGGFVVELVSPDPTNLGGDGYDTFFQAYNTHGQAVGLPLPMPVPSFHSNPKNSSSYDGGNTVLPDQTVGSATLYYSAIDAQGDLYISWNTAGNVDDSFHPEGSVQKYTQDSPTPEVLGSTIRATAGQPFSGTIGTITDPDPSATKATFGATVSWDGKAASPADVEQVGPGHFVINGGSQYDRAGTYSPTITVTDRGTTDYATGTVEVAVPEPTFSISPAAAIHEESNQAFNGPVAAIGVSGGPVDAGAFRGVTVNWGDGTTSAAQVQADGSGGFVVEGSHSYAKPGDYAPVVTADVTPPTTGDVAQPHPEALTTTDQAVVVAQTVPSILLVATDADGRPLPTGTQPQKSSPYNVVAIVKNNDPNAPITVHLKWSGATGPGAPGVPLVTDSAGSTAGGLFAQGGDNLTLAPGESQVVKLTDMTASPKLNSFQQRWDWIPAQNPFEDKPGLAANASLMGSLTAGLGQSIAHFAEAGGTAGAQAAADKLSSASNAATLFQFVIKVAAAYPSLYPSYPVDFSAELNDAGSGQILASTDLPVNLGVPFDRMAKLAGSMAAVLVSDYYGSNAISDTLKATLLGGVGVVGLLTPGAEGVGGAAVTAARSLAVKAALEYAAKKAADEVSNAAYAVAYDPPDPNYTALDSPASAALPPALAGLPEDSTKRLAEAMTQLAAVEDAAATSRNRADGAAAAGDAAWEAKQLAAAAGFEAQAATLQWRVADLAAQLPAPSPTDLASATSSLQSNDLADQTKADLEKLGLTGDDIESGRTVLLAEGAGGVQAAAVAVPTSLRVASLVGADLASDLGAQAVALQTSALKQPVTPVSAADRQTLDADRSAIAAGIAGKAPASSLLPTIDDYAALARHLALSSNNLAALQPDLDAAQADLLQVEQGVDPALAPSNPPVGNPAATTATATAPATTATAPISPPDPLATARAAFVTILYRDALGRGPTAGEQSAGVASLAGGTGTSSFADSLYRSAERKQLLRRHRAPRLSEKAALAAALQQSGLAQAGAKKAPRPQAHRR